MVLQKQKRPAFQMALIAMIMLSASQSFAQLLTSDIPNEQWLRLEEEQYQQGHYTLAAQSADKYLGTTDGKIYKEPAGNIEKAQYYRALSHLKTSAPGCDAEAA